MVCKAPALFLRQQEQQEQQQNTSCHLHYAAFISTACSFTEFFQEPVQIAPSELVALTEFKWQKNKSLAAFTRRNRPAQVWLIDHVEF